MTFLLILKSLFPFLKEWFLKDKALQEVVAQNKLACFLIACILVVFFVFIRVNSSVDKTFADLTVAKQQREHDVSTMVDLRERIAVLESEKQRLLEHAFGKCGPPKKEEALPKAQATPILKEQPQDYDSSKSPPKDPAKTPITADRPRRYVPDKSLRDYVEDKLKNL